MPKLYEHAKKIPEADEERRRTFNMDTLHKIMEVYFLSAIIHQCNIAFSVVNVQLCS